MLCLLRRVLLAGAVAAGVFMAVLLAAFSLDSTGIRREEPGTPLSGESPERWAFPPARQTAQPAESIAEPPGFLRELATVGGGAAPVYLIAAAESGSESRANLLLKLGLDVNATDAGGRTPLFVAAAKTNLALVEKFLAAGANANIAEAEGRTPLMAAAAAGSGPVMAALLDHGARIDQPDRAGRTALVYAIESQKQPAVSLLLSRGADGARAGADGRRPLDFAWESGARPLFHAVLAAQPPTLRWSASTREALSAALAAGDRETLSLLLKKHPAPPTPENASEPLLAYAIARGDIAQLRLLLECGADANAPLAIPAEKSFTQLLHGEMLPHYLATEPGMTPLMLAAGLGRTDMAQLLIEHGAKRGAETAKYKIAAVTFAAWADSAPTLLVLYGKSPRIEDQATRVEISLENQRALFFKNNVLALSSPVSTGKAGRATPTGQFVITDKHATHKSTIYKVDMPWFMRLNCREFGMHKGVVPNYPASHGCIRMPGDKAQELFQQVDLGTLVVISQ